MIKDLATTSPGIEEIDILFTHNLLDRIQSHAPNLFAKAAGIGGIPLFPRGRNGMDEHLADFCQIEYLFEGFSSFHL